MTRILYDENISQQYIHEAFEFPVLLMRLQKSSLQIVIFWVWNSPTKILNFPKQTANKNFGGFKAFKRVNSYTFIRKVFIIGFFTPKSLTLILSVHPMILIFKRTESSN